MPFNADNFSPSSVRYQNKARLCTYYADTDALWTVAAAGYFNDVIDQIETGDKILITCSQELYPQLSYSGTFRIDADTSIVYLDLDNRHLITTFLTDVSTASSTNLPSPTGLILSFSGVLDTAITAASVNVIAKIGSTAITGASLTFTTAMSAGTVVSAFPTANYILSYPSQLVVESDGASSTTSRGNFMFEIACPAQVYFGV